MAQINMRYGGQIHTIDDGPNFNPQSYGTKRLKARVNSSSTLEFGLTTNTNAKEYCKLAVRVGGQTAYIGRISSIEYESGATPERNGSTMVNSASNTYEMTRASGSGTGTSPTNPTIRTVTNATGSSVTSATASEQIQVITNTYYSASGEIRATQYNNAKENGIDYGTKSVGKTSSLASGSSILSRYLNASSVTNISDMEILVRLIEASSSKFTAKYTTEYYSRTITLYPNSPYSDKNFTTSGYDNKTITTSKTILNTVPFYVTTTTSLRPSGQQTRTNTTITFEGIYNATSLSSHTKNYSSSKGNPVTYMTIPTATNTYKTFSITNNMQITHPVIQTLYNYSYQTRYSYSWTSCEKYLTTKISETLHNINL